MSSVWIEAPRRGAIARARVGSLADVREIETIPCTELLPSWSILGALEATASVRPDATALITADNHDPTRAHARLSYAALVGQVRATANRLHEVCGGAPAVVSILTPLIAEAFIASWAGATAGVANCINPFLRVDHVAEIMKAAGTTVLVCGTARHGAGAWNEVTQLRARVPTLRAVWYVDDSAGEQAFARQIGAAEQGCLRFAPPAGEDRAATLLHTGGTTAAPKLVQLTERGQLLNAWCCGTYNGSAPDGVVALGMPYFHVGGAIALALAAMVFGQAMVIVGADGYRSPRVIAGFWDLVRAHGVTLAGSAPTTAAALVAAQGHAVAPPGFAYWSGGATVPVQVAREFQDKFGVPLREGWGMTELQGALVLNPRGCEPRLGSIGIPFPYHRVRALVPGAAAADDLAAPGSIGVLAVSGPCVTPGYLGAAQGSSLFLESADPAGHWLNTGDLCTIDAQGYVWLRGRSKDLIIRGAHNIDPLTIEDALLAHPAVLYAAAIGAPDRDKGELPVAYVQLRPGAAVSAPELLSHCQRDICERAAVPREVRIVDVMPLTAVGKIYKPALRLDATRRCVQGSLDSMSASAVEAEVREQGGAIAVVLRLADPAMARLVEAVREELEHYTFRVEVERTCGPD